MQITLEALELALAPIEEVGKGESVFDVNGTPITLKMLLPEEEAEVQKFANYVLSPEGEEGRGNAMEYLERFKLGILSHCIIAIGAQDLRDVDYVETGEKLPNGTAVKVSRVLALRKIIMKWSNPVRLAMFRKYTELVTQVERQAELAIKFDPSDIDEEIERLESRVASLKETRDAHAKSLENDMSKMVRAVADEDARKQRVREEAFITEEVPAQAEPVQATHIEPEPAPVAPQVPQARRSSIPPVATPQARPQVQPPRPPPPPVPDAGHYVAGMDVPDSFVDSADSGSMDEAIQAENIRLMRQRQAASGQPQQEVPSLLTSIRRAPHMDARVLEEPEYVGQRDGVDGFRINPPEEVNMPRVPAPEKAPPPKGVNPRFNPPKKPL